MELNEIKAKIAELRRTATELADECYQLRARTANPHQKSVADYLQYELTAISCKLSDMEETEEHDKPTLTDAQILGDTSEADTISDWWTDLELCDKCELANIPYPTCDYGRGDDYIEAEDRADKWWNSRTYEQKKDIHDSFEEYNEE